MPQHALVQGGEARALLNIADCHDRRNLLATGTLSNDTCNCKEIAPFLRQTTKRFLKSSVGLTATSPEHIMENKSSSPQNHHKITQANGTPTQSTSLTFPFPCKASIKCSPQLAATGLVN